MNDTKIFLTGTARGGTSLVAHMLSANKDVNVTIDLLMEILSCVGLLQEIARACDLSIL